MIVLSGYILNSHAQHQSKKTSKRKEKTCSVLSDSCSDCKKTFERIDLWPHSEISGGFICRNCNTTRRLKKQKSFESDFRRFRKRPDYVSQEAIFQTSQSRVSDDEFDEIIQEFEQAHWTEISEAESLTHKKYIESLFKREFWERTHGKHEKRYEKIPQTFEGTDIAIHYNLLGVSEISTNVQVKDAYRRLILKWHPDKNPNETKYAEKMLILIKNAFDEIMKSRK